MRGRTALLPLVLVLFLVLLATNTDWIKDIENPGSSAGDLLTDMTVGEISLSNNEEYRDGLINIFDYFINSGYLSGYA